MLDPAFEWAQIKPNTVVISNQNTSWLHAVDLLSGLDTFARPMQGRGSPGTSRALLDGIIAAAQQGLTPTPAPPITAARWAWRLCGYYHTTHATPILMREAATRFAKAGRTGLAAYAKLKIKDEAGHDALALKDLRALGYAAESVVKNLAPPTAVALVALFTELVLSAAPVSCLGYVYALERLATLSGLRYISQVEAALPQGVHATRCLRVHSGLGADAAHVDDAVRVIAGLPAEERIKVAEACYRAAVLCVSPPINGHPDEQWLQQQLARYAL